VIGLSPGGGGGIPNGKLKGGINPGTCCGIPGGNGGGPPVNEGCIPGNIGGGPANGATPPGISGIIPSPCSLTIRW